MAIRRANIIYTLKQEQYAVDIEKICEVVIWIVQLKKKR